MSEIYDRTDAVRVASDLEFRRQISKTLAEIKEEIHHQNMSINAHFEEELCSRRNLERFTKGVGKVDEFIISVRENIRKIRFWFILVFVGLCIMLLSFYLSLFIHSSPIASLHYSISPNHIYHEFSFKQ